ncbi:aminotransferase class I/II-fold pyridoxal phosphate-dependent enzyme [Oceanobacillus piezotolerans]|uniref:Aminotransferase class I/II-fold pyridoxal phosphate-dependent enzyme n=1 Tax=Oceanobacillus piezotolerans TaxID=2448030 RepID=A0A498DIW1_9BACI|nr:aminotransferase class I/II-fold pyridoxal phosphate-dependent enzyme [Oceanobacillus piezotolerans]RLL41706.1 aminotransferase class I/II-fold pyridoxal phosphate-dependent enzyme [Oceanobacillus piezotolerans]
MNHKQLELPLFTKLQTFQDKNPISFHVPGHKNGSVFPHQAKGTFQSILKYDMTELNGLDDLHAPSEVIKEAEELAQDYFNSKHTFFLVGGSTVGNLAMLLATCQGGDHIIVQRNCHKSIVNGLELCGAKPIFITPEYEEALERYTSPSVATLQEALHRYPDAKAVVLTYPDYFGRTYSIKEMIDLIHSYEIPVLVDEAHGVHFSLGSPFPPSALELGADVVVHSAHKMAPAMTMSSYLHVNSMLVSEDKIAHYLQILQSSSPSYPLMASLDIARYFLANITKEELEEIKESVAYVRDIFERSDIWNVLPISEKDDFLKITLHVKHQYAANEVTRIFEENQIYPELTTHNQILFIHGLAPFNEDRRLKNAIKSVNEQLKNNENHATIDISKQFPKKIQELDLSYTTMNKLKIIEVPYEEGIGHISAESIIPYPPGIPFLLKGERITEAHFKALAEMTEQGIRLQQRNRERIKIYRHKGDQLS